MNLSVIKGVSLALGVLLAWQANASQPQSSKATPTQSAKKSAYQAPVFKSGESYFETVRANPRDVSEKMRVRLFFSYGDERSLAASDNVRAFARSLPNQVEIIDTPIIKQADFFTARLHYAFETFGRPELSRQFLFDSANAKGERALVKDEQNFRAWLKKQNVDAKAFFRVFVSAKVEQQMSEARRIGAEYRLPDSFVPYAIINGQYAIGKGQLVNDDFSMGVLQFLHEKTASQHRSATPEPQSQPQPQSAIDKLNEILK